MPTRGRPRKKRYKFKSFFASKSPVAQEVGEFLEVKFPDGKLTPHRVVQAAKSPQSPLHDFFEWDDTKAADRYRVQQARQLINCLVVVENKRQLRAYENITFEVESGEHERTYLALNKIRQSEDLIEQVLQAALKEIKYWKAKWERYSDYFGVVFKAIDKVEETLTKPRRKKHGKKEERRSNRNHRDGRGVNPNPPN